MGLFSNLMDKVFGKDDAAKKRDVPVVSESAPDEKDGVDLNADTVPLNDDTGAVTAKIEPAAVAAASAVPAVDPAPEPSTPEPVELVDVEANLDALEKEHPEDLDWKKSIVDLCKLLDIDSSYGARKEMALELGYTQEKIDADGSAEMNMWLHKTVMGKIAANGGKLPPGLAD